MALFNQLEQFPEQQPTPEPVDLSSDIPKELNIFYRGIDSFIPDGKTLADLTPEELKKVKSQYRFDYYRPGMYQTITGFGNMT